MKLEKVKLTFKDGVVYEGDFLNNKAHGKGKLTFVKGTLYESIINGKRGPGEFIVENGDVYEGNFAQGKALGKGKIIFADGGSAEVDFSCMDLQNLVL